MTIKFPIADYTLLRAGESVLVEAHDGTPAGRRFDGQHVKSAGGFGNAARGQKLARDAAENAALVVRDGIFGKARAFAAAHFHFDERQNGAVVSDQVDFAVQAGDLEVARNDGVVVTT